MQLLQLCHFGLFYHTKCSQPKVTAASCLSRQLCFLNARDDSFCRLVIISGTFRIAHVDLLFKIHMMQNFTEFSATREFLVFSA